MPDSRDDAQGRHLPKVRCRSCHKRLDAASTPDGRDEHRPKPGDFSVCIYCGDVAVFTDSMRLREPTGPEIVDIAGARDLLQAQRVVSAWRRRRE
jgi:hypothetical protein